MFTYLNPLIYWLLILTWGAILWFCVSRLKYWKTTSAFFVTVLLILAIDAIRTLAESIYFGVRETARFGMLPQVVAETLNIPELTRIPKLINLGAALIIAATLYRKWLPMQEADQRKTEQHIKELEDRTIEQNITEQALRESEERFRNIVEASPMGMHLYELQENGDLILTGANPIADAILGINHTQRIGQKLEEAFPDLMYSQIPDRYRKICRDGGTWQSEDLRHEDDMISRAFEVYAFQTLPGQMATQFIDITQRKQTEATLTMAQFTLDHAAISIFWISMKGYISYVNESGCTLFGYTREELLSMRIDELTPDSAMREFTLAKIKTAGSTTFESTGLHKDGSTIPLEITSHYIQFDGDEFEFIFVVDLTTKKKSEEALAAMNKNLENLVMERTLDLEQAAAKLEDANIRLSEVDRMKSSMLSSVTHELKTPLTSIIGYSKLTERDFTREFLPMVAGNTSLTRRGNRISENLSIIGQDGARLLILIENILALSRIRAGTSKGEHSLVDMAATLKRAVNLSQSHFSAQPDISLRVSVEEDLPAILADPEGILQVIINLLDNAAKFGGQGEVYLSATHHDDIVRISVKDSGPGIPAEEQNKVFEPFYQVCKDDACTIKPEGTGMGLAICKQVVEDCGGTIHMKCADTGGCDFIVELPVESHTVTQ